MHDESIDEALSDLVTALEVRPSAAFQAKVRMAVSRQERRTRRVPALVALLCAAAVILLLAVRRPAPPAAVVRNDAPEPIASARQQPDEQPAPRALAVVAPKPRRGLRTASVVASEPPTEQELALLLLLGAIRSGRATVPASVGPRFDTDGLLAPPPPIVISPVTISPLPLPTGDDESRHD